MNENKRIVKKYSVQQGNKKIDNIEEASVKKNMKVDIGNESPQHSYDSRVSGHSTPITKRDHTIDIEDSPELDYRCSPISFPCTQDGGNEIAWDWQTSVNKNSNEKAKSQNSHVETPKRTKQLQKKRNSNSPLLQKPLKRKQVKMENIENIGKLTAELKALAEKMKNIQQNHKIHDITNGDVKEYEPKSELLIEIDDEISDDIMIQVVDNNEIKVDSVGVNNNIKKGISYEDFFDDSIDDSMVRCSQEVEEKFNLCKNKGNEIMELSTLSKKKDLFSTFEKEFPYVKSNNSTESSKSSSVSKSSLTDMSGHLKTYSSNSSKINSSSSVSFSNSKKVNLQTTFVNKSVKYVPSEKHTLKEKNMSQFPDDSFDDCLATCVEDDKLLSKLSEYDFNASSSDHNLNHFKKTPKQVISNTVNNRKTSNSSPSKSVDVVHSVKPSNYKNSKLITDDLEEIEVINDKEAIQKSFPGKTALENRKFFKTKSLSDHCFYQNRNSNTNGKTNKTSNSISSQKRFQSNSINSSVSTNSSVVKSQNFCKTNNFSSINGMENAHALNRLEKKEAGNCIIKYKSASNLSSTKEVVKGSQSVQCTPEEIERKRLEAKMRLEAKRKSQQSTRIVNATSRVPVEKSVKR